MWCRRCSGNYAWRRLGPTLMNRSRTEENDTKERGKMLERIHKLEEGEIPERIAEG